MQTTQKVPTWQILSDDGKNYRWVSSGTDSATTTEEPPSLVIPIENPKSRLPSMTDVLIQGSSKLLKNSGSSNEDYPMFRTGLGKSVEIKKSSILKALSVLGENDSPDGDKVFGAANDHSFSNSLFQTASGKAVNISSAGLTRAKTLLGLEGKPNNFTTSESDAWGNSQHLDVGVEGHTNGFVNYRDTTTGTVGYPTNSHTPVHQSEKEAVQNFMGSEMCKPSSKPPEIKFQTAGGRSISVSKDALERAKTLLGDTEIGGLPNEESTDCQMFSFFKGNRFDETSLNKENDPYESCLPLNLTTSRFTSNGFPPPRVPLSKHKQFSANLEGSFTGNNSLKLVDENDSLYNGFSKTNSSIPCVQSQRRNTGAPHKVLSSAGKDIGSRVNPMGRPLVDISNNIGTGYSRNSLAKNIDSKANPVGRPPIAPLIDIPSNTRVASANQKQVTSEKRKLGRRSSVSPFKRPRISRFSTPLDSNMSFLPKVISEDSSCKTKVSSKFPFHVERVTVKEYFGGPPRHRLIEPIQDKVKCMNVDHAETYLFQDASGMDGIGVEAFHHMLVESGASVLNASREWVANHFKWIVWKLACYERGYLEKCGGKYLTVPNVLEELKYRYEREVNHGHRSALKRILEGDASASSMVILCISAIRFNPIKGLEMERRFNPDEDAKKPSQVAKVELTDGWYSIDASLDVALTNLLIAGKLFVGQKLRIWRASLCGWVGPTSPLEASKTASLLLHRNGTYRAHWAARLGFCKEVGAPLAFRCIKGEGGLVPRTLVGVSRVYPVLFMERLRDGGSVVRSERMESKVRQLYNERRSTIAEGITSELQRDFSSSHNKNDSDSEEGAQIFKILEKAADPEVLMADMSTEQLASFATYQAKQEGIRQADIHKKIEKALEDAGLSERQVSPLMKVRVVGLTSTRSSIKSCPTEGLITIWNPTEKQQLELMEGQVYIVSGLISLRSDSDILYLQARGSTTKWQPLHPSALESFKPFFSPRKSVSLSSMGEVPLASEFDIAAVIVYVGEAYMSGIQKKQWVFVTDDSISGSDLLPEGSSNSLLAISFSFPSIDNSSFSPINCTTVGSTVCFCNLVKRAKDQVNDVWVAEATDNSIHSFSYDVPAYSHLKEAAASAYQWATVSSLTIQKLKERVLFIVAKS